MYLLSVVMQVEIILGSVVIDEHIATHRTLKLVMCYNAVHLKYYTASLSIMTAHNSFICKPNMYEVQLKRNSC
jgi:hypothetical protein